MQDSVRPTPERQKTLSWLHTQLQSVLEGNLVLHKSKKRSSDQSAVRKSAGWKCKDPHWLWCHKLKLVTSAGHLPMLKVTPVAKAGCWAQTSPLPPLPLLLLNLQSNPGRLHSFLLREARLYSMSSLLIEILDIISPENLEILQLNGKNTLDHRSQTDGDTLHASNINKILILR